MLHGQHTLGKAMPRKVESFHAYQMIHIDPDMIRTDSLSHMLHNRGTTLCWEPQDVFILIHKYSNSNLYSYQTKCHSRIASLDVDCNDEID
jgi:hypothetical protein